MKDNSNNIIKVALVQQRCSDNRIDNLNKTKQYLIEAKEKGAQLVLLQELHNYLYFCQKQDTNNFSLAESIPGDTTDFIAKIAKELELVIVMSVFEKRAEGLYHNTAVVLEKDGEIAGVYRKMHIPQDPGFEEKFYFSPGDLGFEPIDTSVGKLGVLICWDQWFSEAARIMALKGADLLLYPTAIGWDPKDTNEEKAKQCDAWVTVQRGHSVSNAIPVLSCNRVGNEKIKENEAGIDFWGTSFITGSFGEFLAKSSSNKEEILIATIDKSETSKTRNTWPFFRDRRVDAYADISKKHSYK